MVVALLTLMTLAVFQLAFALHIRNTLLDAASEGARFASLADNGVDEGAIRTRELIAAALGETYAHNVTADSGDWMGYPAVIITVSAPLPLVGLVGVDRALEVVGHAPLETVE
jgi:hypothetical protein